jgi:hypothetical protein
VSGTAVPLAAVVGLALTGAGAAAAARPHVEVRPGEELARVVAPAPGADLVAGESAWIEWRPEPGLARHPEVEEWEAFLSLDGGRTFTVRLTPHLDLGRSRAAFTVPPLPSGDVRLLLRFGDERVEWEQPVPGRFRIVPGASPHPVLRRRAPAAGEAARPGEPGVVLWAEGARDGSGRREVEAWDPFHGVALSCPAQPSLAVAALAPEPPRPAADPRAARAACRDLPASPPRRPVAAIPDVQPILLLLHRLNR